VSHSGVALIASCDVSAMCLVCIDSRHTCLASAYWDVDELVRFMGQNVENHGHSDAN